MPTDKEPGQAPMNDTMEDFPTITRVVLVDHSPSSERGLVFEKWNLKKVSLSVQDEGRTLKVFVR